MNSNHNSSTNVSKRAKTTEVAVRQQHRNNNKPHAWHMHRCTHSVQTAQCAPDTRTFRLCFAFDNLLFTRARSRHPTRHHQHRLACTRYAMPSTAVVYLHLRYFFSFVNVYYDLLCIASCVRVCMLHVYVHFTIIFIHILINIRRALQICILTRMRRRNVLFGMHTLRSTHTQHSRRRPRMCVSVWWRAHGTFSSLSACVLRACVVVNATIASTPSHGCVASTFVSTVHRLIRCKRTEWNA